MKKIRLSASLLFLTVVFSCNNNTEDPGAATGPEQYTPNYDSTYNLCANGRWQDSVRITYASVDSILYQSLTDFGTHYKPTTEFIEAVENCFE